jgi:CubicO group peptidase (beta-lactamase class C family)
MFWNCSPGPRRAVGRVAHSKSKEFLVFARLRTAAFVIIVALWDGLSIAQGSSAAAIDAYVRPYVESGNFAGSIAVEKKGEVVFEKAYGFADREHRVRNNAATRFHVASVSMQFTAAAILRLADAGSVSLDDRVDQFVPEIQGADKITIRDLLTERSGLPDINALPSYDNLLQQHQTPSSLVAKIEGKPLLFEPGSKYLHEEHSAYNLLALIVEKKTGLPFDAAVERLVFRPLGLTASGVDNDLAPVTQMAHGYEPDGAYELRPAKAIHWSAKAGNASVYTTAADEARSVDELFNKDALSAASRKAILDLSMPVGYGWFKGENKRFGGTAYYSNGRSPGFASFVLYLPDTQTTVVVLSNIYSSATTTIGYDIAALSLGLPYESFHFQNPAPGPAELESCTGTFQFGPDFYQPDANVTLMVKGRELAMQWPSGGVSALIPLQKDHFIDRSYWEDVKLERDAAGKPVALTYNRFHGTASGTLARPSP